MRNGLKVDGVSLASVWTTQEKNFPKQFYSGVQKMLESNMLLGFELNDLAAVLYNADHPMLAFAENLLLARTAEQVTDLFNKLKQ